MRGVCLWRVGSSPTTRTILFIARLCKGSTSDSDSLCSGSNPDRAATTSERTLLRSDFSLQKNQPHESIVPPFSQKGTLGSVASALVTTHCRCRLFERNAPAALGIHFVRESSIKINCTVMRFIFLYTIFETLFC